ncbi:LysR family transcriptional regulator [Eggerthella sinensis]|uniref:LysR family transcriptional regulator n=1 Tax=Eggerthella sinensis TaxID=242230 RepID=A0A3N0IUH5_9ACTN|nr:LysR family transcriptional regulator [Eggerthella sinensis]RDB68146.1 LysR family transcriptional regulator [Eggerthella sinensis]RNM40547.1 LysR family transcriptional regulator [Eggerthella sinensis]
MDTNVQKYLAFVKTVEHGSFTKAAEVLHYSQSGVSRMINDLERDWGMALLERGRSGVRLTSDGAVLLPYAEGVCAAHGRLQAQIDELNGLQAGLIRIGTFSSVATHWLPNIIKEFQKDYPAIDYELVLGDYAEIERWIADGRVDCGFLRLPTRPEFDIVPLARDELLVVLPEDHPLASCERFPVQALGDDPFMLLAKDGNADVANALQRLGVAVDVRFTTWDDYAIMSMVESGLGIGLLPQLILQRAPYRIKALPLEVPVHREICLATRDEAHAPRAVKRFLAYLDCRMPARADVLTR